MSDEFKFLASADLHLSNALPHARATQNGLTDRFEQQIEMLRHMGLEAHKRNAEAVLILGDVFDKKLLDPVTAAHVAKAFNEFFDAKLWFLGGNHDANNLRGDRSLVEMLGELRTHSDAGAPLVLDTDIRPRPWLRFWPANFAPVAATREELKRIRKEIKNEGDLDDWFDVLLIHNSVVGCSHMAWTCDDGLEAKEVCRGFNLVLAGHFHKTQEFGECGLYLGAPMQHHFGDVGEDRGFWEFTITEDGEVEQKFIATKTPKFHKRKSFRDAINVKAGDYLWYEIEATVADWQSLKTEGAALKRKLESDLGVFVRVTHKPIYHHEARLGNDDFADAGVKLETLATKYVDNVDVVTGNLDPDRLKEIAREAFKAVSK